MYSVGTAPDRKAVLDRFWELKEKDPDFSLHDYAGQLGMPYYTLRDWYRDPRYNARFFKRKAR